MNFAGLAFLMIAHYFSGKGVLRLFKLQLKPLANFCLSVMMGVPLLSFAPCILQLAGIPITAVSVLCSVAVLALLCSIPLFVNFKRPEFIKTGYPEFYEWPFIAVVGILALISIWRCFYFPPFSRDMLSGPELIAEYTVREGTMVNSAFSVDLSTTNNYFKSPYITGLQIIYKLLVCPFGQLWLSALFVPFITWIYSVLRERIHPVLAGFLMLFFIAAPELYAYTYLILYDYSNMVFFFCGFYFLARYMEDQKRSMFIFSAFLFGLATYIRTETLVLITMIIPLLVVFFYRKREPIKNVIYRLCIFLVIPVAFYLLCIQVFVRHFIPIPFDLGSQVNQHLGDVSVFFQRLKDMITIIIFSNAGVDIYGYLFLFFIGIVAADLVLVRRFNREAIVMLYGFCVVFFGLAFLGYLLPLVDLENTTKRGMFKAMPLALLYLSNSGILRRIAGFIGQYEHKTEAPPAKRKGKKVVG